LVVYVLVIVASKVFERGFVFVLALKDLGLDYLVTSVFSPTRLLTKPHVLRSCFSSEPGFGESIPCELVSGGKISNDVVGVILRLQKGAVH